MTTAITLQGLSKQFGRKTAVQDVSFDVNKGDVFGLLGPNGAGKTTIIRMIVGLMRPTRGEARVFGFDPQTQRRDVLVRSATILESPAMYPKLSARDNLRSMALISGITDRNQVDRVLSTVGLLDRAKDKFESFSLGMKQRLCIAASLLNNPDLIILDEPTNGLDPAGMADIRDLIRTLASGGQTVLLSSHLLHEVQQVCNRVAILQRGSVITSGAVDTMLSAQVAYKIRVSASESDAAQRILTGQGLSVTHEASPTPDSADVTLSVQSAGADSEVSSTMTGRELNRLLAAQGIYADAITLERGSLEDFYLSLTRPGVDAVANQFGKAKS